MSGIYVRWRRTPMSSSLTLAHMAKRIYLTRPSWLFLYLYPNPLPAAAPTTTHPVAKDDPTLALSSLKAGLEILGGQTVKSSRIFDTLWPWLQDLIHFGEVCVCVCVCVCMFFFVCTCECLASGMWGPLLLLCVCVCVCVCVYVCVQMSERDRLCGTAWSLAHYVCVCVCVLVCVLRNTGGGSGDRLAGAALPAADPASLQSKGRRCTARNDGLR
jgi:hypothetical protein